MPNFAQLKRSDPAHILPGYDYDAITEEALLTRMSVKGGRLVLPDGMSYRVLVLPDRKMHLPAGAAETQQLVAAGRHSDRAKAKRASGLKNFPECDAQVAKLASQLWADCDGKSLKRHAFGKGRVVSGQTAREVLLG